MHLGKIIFYSGGHDYEDFQMTPNEDAIQGCTPLEAPWSTGVLCRQSSIQSHFLRLHHLQFPVFDLSLRPGV